MHLFFFFLFCMFVFGVLLFSVWRLACLFIWLKLMISILFAFCFIPCFVFLLLAPLLLSIKLVVCFPLSLLVTLAEVVDRSWKQAAPYLYPTCSPWDSGQEENPKELKNSGMSVALIGLA